MNDVDSSAFRVLSLCSGVGMLDLGIRLAVPHARTVCYVEREIPACEILAARMADGSLPPAPVWLDLAGFDGTRWRGAVDCVTAGFPCQPWSVAGDKRGIDDSRWIWDDIGRIIRDVRPGWVFLENVPGLVSGGGLGYVLGTLAELGFAAEWDLFSAAEAGAPHERDRWFCLAHAAQFGERESDGAERAVAREESRVHAGRRQSGSGDELADPCRESLAAECTLSGESAPSLPPTRCAGGRIWPPGPHDRDAWADVLRTDPDLAPATEPPVRRVVDGGARRMDRLHALGNGCVPVMAAVAFRTLLRHLRGG